MFSEGGKLVFVPDFGNEHDCPRPLHLLELRAESFAKQPLDPIALHALAVPFSHRDAHARLRRGHTDHREGRGKRPPAFRKKLLEVRLFFNSQIFHAFLPLPFPAVALP